MPEFPPPLFHLDHPAGQTEFPAGLLVMQGWVADPQGLPLCDLRVWHNGVEQSVCHGFLRPDLAAHFNARNPFAGGFEATIQLPIGLSEIKFEACDVGGTWHTLRTINLQGLPSPAIITAPRAATLLPHEFARALRLVLRRNASEALPLAVKNVVDRLPQQHAIRYPHRPFHGHLHQPALLARSLFGRMLVEGWLFHETEEIREVVATVDLQVWQTIDYGAEMPAIAAQFPDSPHARNSRIEGWIDVPAQLSSPVSVRVYARLSDDSWHLCHVYRTCPWDGEQEKAAFAQFSRLTFWRSWRALALYLSQRGFVLAEGASQWKAVKEVYAEFSSQAPRSRHATSTADSSEKSVLPSTLPTSVALITHNLSYEGAPLFLVEYARYLLAQRVTLQVISPVDGPLADVYRNMGASVSIIDISPLNEAVTSRQLTQKISQLSRQVDLTTTSLVVANTLSAYWGIHLAKQARRPSLFYIHESTTPASFYHGHLPPVLLPLIESTFAMATHVSFLTISTRAYYLPLLSRPNHSINPGWIEIGPLDAYLAQHSRTTLRARLSLEAEEKLIINLGTVCDRKGQHIFMRAVDQLWRRNPALAAKCRFIMIGGHETLFDHAMLGLLRQINRPNLVIVPATKEPFAYYGAADLFVCSSYEESFPRVILEAMASHVPILSTSVHGIPEMVREGMEGKLVPPGDSAALYTSMVSLLSAPEKCKALVAAARLRVTANFDAAILLPRHAALAARVAAEGGS